MSKETDSKKPAEFKRPMVIEVSDGEGGSKKVVLDGDQPLKLPRHRVMQAANNLEFALQRGAFGQMGVEELHSITGNIVELKQIALEGVKDAPEAS